MIGQRVRALGDLYEREGARLWRAVFAYNIRQVLLVGPGTAPDGGDAGLVVLDARPG